MIVFKNELFKCSSNKIINFIGYYYKIKLNYL